MANPARNSVRLSGALIEKKAKRFTPAGIPVIEGLVGHESDVIEAGARRKIQCEVRLKAIGEIAERLDSIAIGTELLLQGFLAPARQTGRQLIFHLTNFELE